MTSMTLLKNKKFKYKRVRITWFDITQNEQAWVHESEVEDTELSTCVDEGYVYAKTKDKVWTFSGYTMNDDGTMDVSNVNVFPRCVIKKIEVIK